MWDRLSLMVRLLLAVVLSMAIALLGLAYYDAHKTVINIQGDLAARSQQDMEILEYMVASALVADASSSDPLPVRLKAVLQDLKHGPEVVHVSFRDTSDAVSACYDTPLALESPLWFSRWCGLEEIRENRAMMIDGEYYGVLTQIISPHYAINQVWERYVKRMQMLVLCFVLLWLVMTWVLRQGLLPLKALAKANEALGLGDLSTRLEVRGSPEFRKSLSHFNRMAEKIETARNELRVSEQRFRVLIEQAPDAIVVYDLDEERFVDVNSSAEILFGCSREELLGKGPQCFYPASAPGDLNFSETFSKNLKKTAAGENLTFEQFIRTAHDTHLLCEVRMVMLPDERRRLIRASFIDITQRRQAEKNIQIQAQITTNMAEGVYLVRLIDGLIIYTNPKFEEMFGYGPGEMLWKHVSIVNQPTSKTPDETAEEIMTVLREVKQWKGEIRNVKKDGTAFWSLANVSVFEHPEEGPVLVSVHTDITERKQAEEALHASEERHRAVLATAMDGFWMVDPQGRLLEVNETYCRMSGYNANELMAMGILDIEAVETENDIAARIRKTQLQGQDRFETKHRRKDGTIFDVEVSVQFHPAENGWLVAFLRDISDQKRMEEDREKLQAQLVQAQKMESVGALAGGVAHDYNNMMGVILGYAELALEKVDRSQPLYADLQEIHRAAIRSTEVTRQLLAFARKQTIAPRVIDLNEAVEGMLKMLRRLIGEDIDLTWLPESSLWPVNMDPSQIDQMLANLCINARDAISGVGRITIETGTASFDEIYCSENPGFVPGEFVLLSLSDDGCGMDKETADRVFEPFFTTKGVGQGTGLGLATVYGIIKQNNGFINVYSEPGLGSTFKIYLPRHTGEIEETRQKGPAEPDIRGCETILLVEDELAIITMTTMMLERLGYTVLAAESPDKAISLAQKYPEEIHLLMTDVVMPELNGKELSDRIQALRPTIKSLFMSGYTADVIANHGVLDEGVQFIQKPFSKKDLAIRVHRVLEGEN